MTRSTHHDGYKAFLELLRRTRKASKVTQEALADCLDNRQAFISKIERGDRRLDVVELMEYLNAIGANPATFVRQLAKALKPVKDIKLSARPSAYKRKAGKKG
jgi:transcriptional regulator with XRE-family HTH domain